MTRPPPTARTTTGDARREASFAALKQAIIDRTGHHYYEDKDQLLRDRLDRRLNATGCRGWPDYLALLNDPAAGVAEWQELEAEVTIGETFFFRHTEQFAALQNTILPAIISQKMKAGNAATQTLRIWSAGCAVGAEPYSIAILLERLLGDGFADWTIDIVGSDISRRFLEKARDGCFSSWALRGMPDHQRARDFTYAQDRRQWRIADRHRRHVRFVQHNLLGLFDDGQSVDWAGFDLILCRNVLIYFSLERIAPMMSALGRCLGPEGWLMVGYSDAIAGLPADLGIVDLAGTIAFRPPGCVPSRFASRILDATPPVPMERPVAAIARRPSPQPGAPQPAAPVPAAPQPAAPQPAAPIRDAGPAVSAIRALADSGRLREAADACAQAIAEWPLDARLHFYDGVIAQAAGRPNRAEAALRRAIYLSGRMVMAHYHLGLLLLDGATPDAGRRVMTQVMKLCAALPETDVLPESDGLTARDLIQRTEMRLRPPRSVQALRHG